MSHYMESEAVELKEKYTDTICREIVAFLNSEGGTMFNSLLQFAKSLPRKSLINNSQTNFK